MIKIVNLVKKYNDGKLAVDNISLEIEDGKIYGFLGPNGAGKSSTMNMLTGCISATDGDVIIDGINMFDNPKKAKEGIGYLPEIPPVYPDMTVREYMEFVASLKKIKKNDRKDAIKDAVEKTGLEKEYNRLIGQLSKGYRQRVGLAQAIMGNPKLIILDEPTVGLDPKQVIEVRKIIKEIGKDHTVILSSHIMQEISAVCDKIIVINNGRIVAQDDKENFLKSKSENLDITVKGNKDEIVTILKRFDGIRKFYVKESVREKGAYDIHIVVAKDITASLVTELVTKKMQILKVYTPTNTLEEIYLKITSEDDDEQKEEK